MKNFKVVGIDPASGDCQCALISEGQKKTVHRSFCVTLSDMQKFVAWVQEEEVDVIAIEGCGGLCIPIENILRSNKIPFYSFSAYQIANYRKAILGQNKNNRRDATAVAQYAIARSSQGDLNTYKRTWFPDPVLRSLTRMYEQKQSEATREINRLWKTIHGVSGDLYIALQDLSTATKERVLASIWLLKLLSMYPEIHMWKKHSPQEIARSIQVFRTSVVNKIELLQKLTSNITPLSAVQVTEIQVIASTALAIKQALKALYKQLLIESKKNPFTINLMLYRGIGPLISSQIVAEIIDISRFPNNHHLASYAGLGRREHKTGFNKSEKSSLMFNRRLKNAFFNAAKNFTTFNPDSHLTGFYRSIRARGMTNSEAYKRVSRALARRFYRDLVSVKKEIEKMEYEGNQETIPEEQKALKQPHTPPSLLSYSTIGSKDLAMNNYILKENIESMKIFHGYT
ncbi:MAG: IS110 family transposase [Spirochaetaceae bacterium]|nr:IS110 family transposase [Spirochaetaceae bacterium]MCF7938861.1 IS110 family transposase [Spirochaetales bacterium]